MKIEKLLEDLGETVGRGSETMKICHDRIIDSLSTSLVETEREILVIVDGIASRVRPEVSSDFNPKKIGCDFVK